ncbi:NAD-binding protein, partial [Intrasporangium sp.]|uniref:NAD-binding protein n=1 Tax=Intrasporangium sp. TaxID=1925024 RepID=UPI00293A303E
MGDSERRFPRWRLVATGSLLALALGIWGFGRYDPAASVIEGFYRSLQFFVLESGDTSPPLPWQLEVARLLAPAMTVTSAAFAALSVSRNRVDAWRAGRRAGHVVVCGLGMRGAPAALTLERAGHDVVGVDADPLSAGVRRCRHHRIPVVIGDAGDPLVLARARVASAAHVIVLTPALELSGRVALAAVEQASTRDGEPLSIHLEVDRPELASLLKAVQLTEHQGATWQLEDLDLSGVGARAMLDALHPWPENADRAHVVVVGAEPLAVAVTRELRRRWLRTGHRPDDLHITEIGAGRDRSPADTDLATWDLTSAYVTLTDEAEALASALALQQDHRGLPVLVRLEQAVAFGELVRRESVGLETISLDSSVLTAEVLLASTTERVARALHDSYRRTRAHDDPSAAPWEHLPEPLRASNRAQAQAVADKIRATGRILVPDDGSVPDGFTPDEVDQLGELEHERWVAERRAAGWTAGPRDAAARTTPYLVPWEELDEDVRELDRQFIRALPEILADAGLLLRRRTHLDPVGQERAARQGNARQGNVRQGSQTE